MGETVKELIHNNLMEDGYSEEKIFAVLFQMLLEEENTLSKLNSGELIIGKRGPQLTDEEYVALFGRHLEQNAVDQYQYDMEQALVDSVCAYNTQPELSREDLIKIRKGELKNDEVNKLFNDCLGILNTKFKTQVQPAPQPAQDQAKQPVQDQTEAKRQPAPQQPAQVQVQPQPIQQKKQEEAEKTENLKEDIKDLGDAVLIDKDSDKVYKSFRDIFGEKYLAILNKNQKDESNENENQEESSSEDQSNNGQSNKAQLGTSFLEIITGKPGIKILTTTGLRLKGVEQDGKIVYDEKQISEKEAYRLKKFITSTIQNIIEKGNNKNIKLKNKPTEYTKGKTIKSWIKENIIINGKPATVEDTVAKVVEILGIKNELEIKHLKEDGKNPTVLVRALESDAGLKDVLKDNIKEIKKIVKEKGLKAGYSYIETLYTEIKPLLTEEQQKVFENLLETKKEVEKAENKKIEKQDVTFNIRKNSAELLENRFKELGLYKPFDLVNSSLNESIKLIINKAKKSSIKDAIKYIPVLLKNTKDGLKEDQINGLIKICKNFHIQLFIFKNCFQYEEDIFKKEGDKLLKKANEDAVKQLKNGIDKIDEKLLDKKAKKEIKNKINEKSPNEIIGILNSYSVNNKVNFGNLITDYEEATITKQTKNTEILENAKKKEKEKLEKISKIVNKIVEKAKKAEAEKKEIQLKELTEEASRKILKAADERAKAEKEAKEKAEAERLAKEKAEAEKEVAQKLEEHNRGNQPGEQPQDPNGQQAVRIDIYDQVSGKTVTMFTQRNKLVETGKQNAQKDQQPKETRIMLYKKAFEKVGPAENARISNEAPKDLPEEVKHPQETPLPPEVDEQVGAFRRHARRLLNASKRVAKKLAHIATLGMLFGANDQLQNQQEQQH